MSSGTGLMPENYLPGNWNLMLNSHQLCLQYLLRVPVGKVIAKELRLPFDLIIVRKLPILTILKQVSLYKLDGEVMLNERLVKQLNWAARNKQSYRRCKTWA